MAYAPDVLDAQFHELKVGIDEKDDLIMDFVCAKGTRTVETNGYRFYLQKGGFDAFWKPKN